MGEVDFRGWSFACDPQATERAHAEAGVPDAERCGCLYCLNYAAARSTLHDQEIRELLARVGVPRLRESHLTDLCQVRPGYRLSIVLFHFVGEIRERPDGPAGGIEFRPRTYPLPPSFANLPTVEISVTVEVPWLLSEPEPQ